MAKQNTNAIRDNTKETPQFNTVFPRLSKNPLPLAPGCTQSDPVDIDTLRDWLRIEGIPGLLKGIESITKSYVHLRDCTDEPSDNALFAIEDIDRADRLIAVYNLVNQHVEAYEINYASH